MKNWIKKIFEHQIFVALLIGYIIFQLLCLLLSSSIFFFLNEIVYIGAMVVGIIWLLEEYRKHFKFLPLGIILGLFFTANLILTLIYIPTLVLNPAINWSLENGGGESDPMILMAFFPLVHFIIALIVMLIAALTIKLSIGKNSKAAYNNS